MCPIPAIPDCYENPGICGKDEFCWINQHEKVGGHGWVREGVAPRVGLSQDPASSATRVAASLPAPNPPLHFRHRSLTPPPRPLPCAQWGSWAMGAGGVTPSPESCGDEALQSVEESDASEEQKAAMRSTIARECTSNITYSMGVCLCGWSRGGGTPPVPCFQHECPLLPPCARPPAWAPVPLLPLLLSDSPLTCRPALLTFRPRPAPAAACPAGMEVWKPVRGQCLKYRQEQQSCIAQPISFDNPAFDSNYLRMPNGRVRAGLGSRDAGPRALPAVLLQHQPCAACCSLPPPAHPAATPLHPPPRRRPMYAR